jgi:hypothetical protein
VAGPAAHTRRVRARQQRLVLAVLAVTWGPGLPGAALDLSPLRAWGIVSGYTGLSWALPGVLIGMIIDRLARAERVPLHRLLGLVTGAAAAGLLLLGAATLIGD